MNRFRARPYGGIVSQAVTHRSERKLGAVMKIFLVVVLGFIGASIASPALADTVGEEYDFRIAGNVKNEGEPIASVRI